MKKKIDGLQETKEGEGRKGRTERGRERSVEYSGSSGESVGGKDLEKGHVLMVICTAVRRNE